MLYLGDNFYLNGVDGVDDDQFQDKFELPYADIDLRFDVVLGNHDYGGYGAGWDAWRPPYEIDYTAQSDKWYLPDYYYGLSEGDVDFFALDTNAIFWGDTEAQLDWLTTATAASTAAWKIVFGHHPYISNGTHGNAGEYDGFEWLPVANGEYVKDFMDEGLCGQVDVYLCGHDHALQWMEPTCGVEFLVSGGGSEATAIVGDGPAFYQESTEGLLWVEIDGNQFTGEFWGVDGTLHYTYRFTK